MKIQEREKACLQLLRKLPEKFVLVGGYATSSFDFPRFSVDLDIVIAERDQKKFSQVLKEEGLKLIKEVGDFSRFYKGRMIRFEKIGDGPPVRVDLFVNMIQSRQTDATYTFDYLWRNSERRNVIGYGVRESVQTRVADREMLIALKINSMRTADQRDIIALCNGEVDVKKVMRHLKRCPKEKILAHLDILIEILENPKSKDSIKGVFTISDKVYKKMLDKAKKEITTIKTDLLARGRPKIQ